MVTTDPDVIFEIFRQENKSFMFGYPDGFAKVFGKGNLLVKHGNIHKRAKQITLQLLSPEGMKRNMIRDMDRTTHEHLKSMASQGTLDVKEAIASVCTKKSKNQKFCRPIYLVNWEGFNSDGETYGHRA